MTDAERLCNLERHYRLERAENHRLRDALCDLMGATNCATLFDMTIGSSRDRLIAANKAAADAMSAHEPPTEWTPENEDAASAAPLSARDQSCPSSSLAFGPGNRRSSPTSDISG